MNKTISINISGVIFNIEEDAYELLKNYLDTIARYFKESEGSDEIMEDIETRISELLQEKVESGRTVIQRKEVEEVIVIMGEPEAYIDDNHESASTRSRTKRSKKLFRDPDRKVFAGVLSGISAFFGWRPLWLRLVVVVVAILPFLFNTLTALIVYVILWIVIPIARTTSEKIEMMGETVTIDSIKKKVNEAYDEVTGGRDIASGFQVDRAREGVSDFFDVVENLLLGILKALGKLIGFFHILGAFLAIIAFGAFLIDPFSIGPDSLPFNFQDYANGLFNTQGQAIMFIAGVASQVIVPLLLMFFVGIILLFRPKFNRKATFLTLGFAWLVGLALLLISAIGMGREFTTNHEDITTTDLILPSDTLYLAVRQDSYFSDDKRYTYGNQYEELVTIDNGQIVFGYPHLKLEVTDESREFELRVEKRASARNRQKAMERIANITYQPRIQSDELLLDPIFNVPLSDKYRCQELIMILKVPEGKTVYIGENLPRIMKDPIIGDGISRDEMVGRHIVARAYGFELQLEGL